MWHVLDTVASRVEIGEDKKSEMYPLARETRNLSKVKAKVYSVVFGALSTFTKRL